MPAAIMQLVTPISADDSRVQLSPMDGVILPTLNAGGHVTIQIYDATASETVAGISTAGLFINIVRDPTYARAWSAAAFAVITATSPNALTKDQEDQIYNQVSNAVIGDGTVTVTKNPVSKTVAVTLPTTGVVAGTYGGLVIDAYGRVTSIPTNWPQNALPFWGPAIGGAGGSGAATSANLVSYTPVGGSTVATASNVQGAVVQLETAIAALQIAANDVQSVSAGTGIVLSGSLLNPIVNIASTGISPGIYAGFTVNGRGQITAYSPVAANQVAVSGQAPIVATYLAGTNTYDLAIGTASIGTYGTVQITDPAQIVAGSVSNPATSVPSYQGVVDYVTTLKLPIDSKPVAPAAASVLSTQAIYDPLTATEGKADIPTIDMKGTTGGTALNGVLGVNRNVAAISATSAGSYNVILANALPSANYAVTVNLPRGFFYDIVGKTPSQFTIEIYQLSVSGASILTTLADPGAWAFAVRNF